MVEQTTSTSAATGLEKPAEADALLCSAGMLFRYGDPDSSCVQLALQPTVRPASHAEANARELVITEGVYVWVNVFTDQCFPAWSCSC